MLSRFRSVDIEDMRAFFDENGFAIVSDALHPQSIWDVSYEIGATINAFLAKAGLGAYVGDAVFTDGLLALEDRDHELVASVYDTICQTPSFLRLISDKTIEALVKSILRIGYGHSLYGFTNRCRIDPPGDERRTYGWHQEVFYTLPRARFLQTWAPLVFDTTTATGTIEVAPGSHKEGIARQEWRDEPGRATQIIVAPDVMEKYQPVDVEMKLGELLLFSGKLAHRSGCNTSSQVRYSLVGMYHDIAGRHFMPPKLSFAYRGETPRQFYESTAAKPASAIVEG